MTGCCGLSLQTLKPSIRAPSFVPFCMSFRCTRRNRVGYRRRSFTGSCPGHAIQKTSAWKFTLAGCLWVAKRSKSVPSGLGRNS